MSVGRASQRAISGVFLLDKSSGYSSNSSLQKVRRVFQARKAGHTGSLDPIASGLLPVCLGEAAKLSRFLLDTDKRYRFRVRLGVETDTADIEGRVIATKPIPELSDSLIEAALAPLRGEIDQVPPMYSALKHQGRRLYELARKGIEVERAARRIVIHELRLVVFDAGCLELEVHCSKGAYVRSLAEAIGRFLGCGGHVEMLRRTGVGMLNIAQALTMHELESLTLEERDARLLPMDRLVSHLPAVELNDDMSQRVRQGNPLFVPQAPTQGWVRLYGRSLGFLGLGEVLEDGRVGPRRMLASG
jgi:tRNA pseudouridine55 synthase